jgi:type III restriction enzyme
MIVLKPYQNRVLGSLRDFLRACSAGGSLHNSFHDILTANEFPEAPYIPVISEGLGSSMPYVCLRVPTGGGKTLLACHAAGIAKSDLLHAEQAVVLWLVPSQTILTQTADALRDTRHAYRRALETACAGPVEVLTIEEALGLSRGVVEGSTVVIVATIQAFRAEDTTGRRVYAQNGSLADHFLNLPANRSADLLPGPDGKPVPSLVNVLRLRRPIVIVDEAHNARTELSFGMLGNVMPSCIIEFTATPARTKMPSNVLHYVSAAELKAADMVKLPLKVVTRHPSQKDQLLTEALTLRADLERLALAEAQATGEYLRPVLLIQAVRVDDCEELRTRLTADFGVPKEQIKIATGKLDELPGADEIKSPKCPVRIIITVQKLREGWDCPFAYVLCSLRETRSATAIEQIVGRVLRLPGAKEKQHPDLNCAYAFSVSDNIHEVLAELRDALESNGFTTAEAERIIMPVMPGTLALGSQPKTVTLEPGKEIDTAVAAVQVAALGGKVKLNGKTGALTIIVPLDKQEAESLASCANTLEARAKIHEAVEAVREAERAFGPTVQQQPSPYQLQQNFIVPLLCVEEDGDLFVFESTFLLEHPWRLGQKDAKLSESYNPLKRPTGKAGLVDVNAANQVTAGLMAMEEGEDFVGTLHQQVMELGGSSDWSVEMLVGWLDRRIDHADIPAGEAAVFLRKAILGLMAEFAIQDASTLALDRYRLRDQIERRIQRHREVERKNAFTGWLLPESSLVVTETKTINFVTMSYEPGWNYEGGFQFKKHYFGPKPGELKEKRTDGKMTEEFRCAQFLDGLAEVKFWARNLSRRTTSFRLQTATDWFYPDFICLLQDGRVLAVEYKGSHLSGNDDSGEKRAVGEVWESRSKGRCLFIMPDGADLEAIRRKVSDVLSD